MLLEARRHLTSPAVNPTDIAERFLAALLDGAAAQARQMITAAPWCTPSGLDAMLESGLRTFTDAHVREIRIQEVDIGGWLAYPPGTEAASISLEFRLNEMEWRSAEIFIAVVDGSIGDTRYSAD